MDAPTRTIPTLSGVRLLTATATWLIASLCGHAATPPTITSSPTGKAYTGSEYLYHLTATDAQGDTIAISPVLRRSDQVNTAGAPAVLRQPTSGWQSFTAGQSGFLKAVRLKQYSNTTDRVLRIYAGTGTGGTLIYEQTFPGEGASQDWRVFEFDTGVLVNAGQTYTLQFDGQGRAVEIFIDGSGDHYSSGRSDLDPSIDYMFETVVLVPTTAGLPAWLSFTDNGDGSGDLRGTPPTTAAGATSDLLLVAADATLATVQSFSLQVLPVPRAQSVTLLEQSPGSGPDVGFGVHFSEAVTGVDASDFKLTGSGTAGGSIASVSGSGTDYVVNVSGLSGDGSLRLDLVDDDSITNASGTPLGGPGTGNGDFAGVAYLVDTTAPTAAISAVASPRNLPAGTVTITLSENVVGLDTADFALTLNGNRIDIPPAALSAVSGSSYALDLSSASTGEGGYTLTLAATGSGIRDAAGNVLAADATVSWTMDATAPTAVFTRIDDGGDPTAATLGLTFSEAVTGLNAQDFTLRSGDLTIQGAILVVPANERNYTIEISGLPTAGGDFLLRLVASGSGIQDAAGNVLQADASYAWSVSPPSPPPSPPVVKSVCREDRSPTRRRAVRYRVTFSQEVAGVDTRDFELTTRGRVRARIMAVEQVSPTDFVVRIGRISRNGRLRLDVMDDDSITNLAGIPLGGDGSGNGEFLAGEWYVITTRRGRCRNPRAWWGRLLRLLLGLLKHHLRATAAIASVAPGGTAACSTHDARKRHQGKDNGHRHAKAEHHGKTKRHHNSGHGMRHRREGCHSR